MKKLFRFLGALLSVLVLAEAADLVWLDYSRATITSAVNKVTIAGNGATTSFGFSFIGVSASDISVTFTDASGVQTVLTQGNGTTQYQISLNAPPAGQIWGVGGTVTYNPNGTPIATGTTLTILRTVPLTQTVSLNNQGAFFPTAVETALDLLDMQIQQLNELYGRAIVAPASDSASINLTLPPAAQRANTGLAFDGSGNVIAGTVPSSGIISSAMQPVVSAASLAAGRTAFGLGTMAQENINGGTCGGSTIQDDGSGNARVVFATVPDAINQTVTCAFTGQVHTATGALTYTLPRANTTFNGFGFWVYALTQAVTFTPNAADNFSGMSSGGSVVIPPGTQAYVATNAASSGTWFISVQNNVSLNAPLNLTLSCSTGSSALTCAVKDRNGNDPSTASPVIIGFRDPTAANGDPIPRAITGALSITVPSTATVGTVSGQANRLWIAIFDNAGTPVMGVYNSLNSTGPTILSWDESTPTSGTAIAAASNNSQTWYTNGTVTSKSFRIIGFVESTQPTAGTWSVSPSKVQLFGPGVKRPGETVQELSNPSTAASSTSSATFVAIGPTQAITLSSAANLVRVKGWGTIEVNIIGEPAFLQIARGATLIGLPQEWGLTTVSEPMFLTNYIEALDVPNSTSATYGFQGKIAAASTLSWPPASTGVTISVQEIQI